MRRGVFPRPSRSPRSRSGRPTCKPGTEIRMDRESFLPPPLASARSAVTPWVTEHHHPPVARSGGPGPHGMIQTLRLENYRGFEEYRLRNLRKVNLVVGPNNCGKTSVLEAVQLLVSRGDPRVLIESARRRWESSIGDDRRRTARHPVHHHFHGHRLEPGVGLGVSSSDGYGRVRIHVVEGEPDEPEDLFEYISGSGRPLALLIRAGNDKEGTAFALTEDGSLDWRSPGDATLAPQPTGPTTDPVRDRRVATLSRDGRCMEPGHPPRPGVGSCRGDETPSGGPPDHTFPGR